MMDLLLLQCEPQGQRYTLQVTDVQTKQSNIVSYNGSAILTTYHDQLIDYARRLVTHYGKGKIYTVMTVSPLQEVPY